MRGMSPGTALRQLQQAQAGLKKARQLLKQDREREGHTTSIFEAGWASLAHAHRLLAEIPPEAADEAVLTKQLAVQRYATALLVRLRRLQRHGGIDPSAFSDDDDDRFDEEELED
ncbi:MAG: hypothetical protein ACLQGP_09635 [Isosphaeraceae bacterium]